MTHEVYICYDEKDQITADAICHVLEENKIRCWMKTRDLGVNHMVEEVLEAINQTRAVILIFSDYSKNSNFVNSEVDIAFTENKPILVFKIDESKLDGSLEFFLNNKHWLDAYPNPEVQFGKLVKDTSKLLGKPIAEPVIPEESISKKAEPEREPRQSPKNERPNVKKSKKPRVDDSKPGFGETLARNKIAIIALAVILIAAIGIFTFMSSNDGNMGASDVQIDGKDVSIKITDFHVDDVSKKGYSWKYSYFVGGAISPLPSYEGGYVVSADFYNKDGDLINSTETELAEVEKIGDGLLLASTVSDEKEISRVEVQLLDGNGIVYSQGEKTL